jgi:conserved repeat domain
VVRSIRGRARSRHAARRPWGVRRFVAAASAALLVGSSLSLVAATPAFAAFPTNESIVYLAQGNPTQLMSGQQSAGAISFSNVGSAAPTPTYNALGFNEADGFLYAVRASTGGGASPKIVRIGPAGGITNIKDAAAGSVVGAFGGVADRFYYVNGTTLYWTSVANAAGTTSSRALTGATADLGLDITWLNGYFWSLGANGRIARLNPENGNVVAWTIPALNGHGAAGGAFTYGNGNLGFSKNEGGIVQLRVTNPGDNPPTFSVVSIIAGPASSSNDAAASLGDPTDLAITKTVSATTALRGGSLGYTLTVRNLGPGVSSGYTVSDTIPSTLTIGTLPTGCSRAGQVVTCSGGRLTVNSTATFTIPVTVATNAARGSITNTASVLANENDPVASNNTSTVAFQVLVPSMTLVKTATLDDDGDGVAEVGENVGYDFVVTNTGDLPITGVTITDPLVTGITPASADIPVGGSATFTSAPRPVTQADVDDGSIDNTATANGSTAGGALSATDSASIAIPASPGLVAVKTASLADSNANGVADEAEIITYTIRVTNTGNVTLDGVTVTDALLPALVDAVTLAPGDSHDFVGGYQVQAADLGAGRVVNSATATGTPPSGPPITTPPTTTTTETVRTGITLVKSAEWTDTDSDGVLEEGEEIRYTFIVTNVGNVVVEGVRIEDAFLDARSVAITGPGTTTLAPGEQLVFTSAPLVVAAGDFTGPDVVNTATAYGTPISGTELPSNPSTVTVPLATPAPAITLDKQATLDDANRNGFADVGETIDYRFVVTNTGNLTVEDIVLSDAMFAAGAVTPVGGYAALRPGEQGVFTASHVVDQDDVDRGEIVNTATATATDPLGGPDLTSTDSVTVDVPPADPALTVLKSAALDDENGNGVADENEEITYSFLVRNTGNVTITGITVTDAMFTVPAVGDLAPGQERTVSVVYAVTAADVAAGSIDNSATATGTPPDGTPITTPPSTTTTEAVAPGLDFDKEGELADSDGDGLAGLGEVITYSFLVTNTGNTRLTGVTVVDDFVSDISPTTATLEPGSSLTFSATYVVTEADILAGSVVNTAFARGTVPGGPTVDSADDTWTIGTAAIDVTLLISKSARIADDDGNTVADLGEHIEYTFEVRNAGNVTITGITITDPRVTGLPAPFDLAPGESRTVVADLYEVVQADIDAGEVLNSATASGTGPGGPVPSDPAEVTVPTPPARPALTLVKSVVISGPVNGNGVADPTETLTYTFVVTNTGTVTLDQVAIDDPMVTGATSPDSGPLAPGGTRTFTADYVVLPADVTTPGGSIVNTARALAEAPGGIPVASSVAAAAVPYASPALELGKTAAFDDANGNGMADVGETVTFTFEVRNTGNTELVDIEIEDDFLGTTIAVGTIPAGGSVVRQAVYTVTEADIVAQELVNRARATGFVPGTPPTAITSPDDVASVPLAPDEAHVTLVKEAVLTDTNGNGRADVGEQIVYRFTITNTGNRTVTDIQVADTMIQDLLPGPVASLAPGERVVVESDPYTVDESDIVAEEVRNVATASATGPGGQLSTLPATAIVLVEVPPALANTGTELQVPLLSALAAIGVGGLALALGSRPRRRAV